MGNTVGFHEMAWRLRANMFGAFVPVVLWDTTWPLVVSLEGLLMFYVSIGAHAG